MEKIKLVSLRDILYAFFKNKNKILSILFSAIFISVLYFIFTSPIYKAETKIIVKIGREKFTEIDAYSKESYNILFQERTQNINNEIEILKGPYLAKKVLTKLKEKINSTAEPQKASFIKQIRLLIRTSVKNIKNIFMQPVYFLGLSRKLSQDEELEQIFASSIHAELLEDTDIFKLTFQWDNPDFAAFAVNTYAEEYVAHHIKIHETEESHDFYNEQITMYENKLTDIEKEQEEFRKKGGITDIAFQKDILQKDISDIQKKLNETVIAINNIKTKIKEIKEMSEKSQDWIETPNIGKLGSEITNLKTLDDIYFKMKSERDKSLEDFKPGSREVKSIEHQLYKLRRQKTESLLNILSVELATVDSDRKTLEQHLFQEKELLNNLDSMSLHLTQLERARGIIQNNYLLYKKKAEDLRISNDLNKRQITSVKIISPALPPIQPVYPKKRLILSLAAFLGLFIGIGYSLIYEYFSHTFKDKEDVSAFLEIPLLMTIPCYTKKQVKSNLEHRES